jgi:hypothetical protein
MAEGEGCVSDRQTFEFRLACFSAERLARLAEWICGRWYGATKAQLVEAFEEFYDVCALHSSSERRYYRDMAKLRADGFVWICGRMVRADRAHALTDAA